LEFVVLGLGVNVNAGPPADLKLEYAATSLAEAAGTTLNRAALQSAILDALAQRYAQLGSPQLVAAWAENLALRGEQVNVVGVTETLTGRLAGVTESGALLLELAGGAQRAVPAGAVHLRRAEPAPDLHQNFGGSKLGVKSTEAH
jgi:BirA family biotin operon repressor/biotin-[acetyl-CoA-carboxylase] ligase